MIRRVLDTLHESVTDTHCGKCPSQERKRTTGLLRCIRYADVIGYVSDLEGNRCPSCLAAESRAARMVEIAPEDLARGPFTVIGGWSVGSCAAAERIEAAIEEHAKKVVKR